jgi:hypothetical protein
MAAEVTPAISRELFDALPEVVFRPCGMEQVHSDKPQR